MSDYKSRLNLNLNVIKEDEPTFVIPNSKFELGCPIGHGTFGQVFKFVDPRDGKVAAVKKLTNGFQDFNQAKRTFRELTILYNLKHDNLLSLKGVVELPPFYRFNTLCMVTELLQTDLYKIITFGPEITKQNIRLIMYQIVRGLKFLHFAGIIHRDLKPGNIFLNENYALKIGDFGVGRGFENEADQNMTPEVCTQYYSAPEVLMGARHYTTAVDMWSVGCIYVELITRRILFSATGVLELFEVITDMLGTPSLEDLPHISTHCRRYVLSQHPKEPQQHLFRTLPGDVEIESDVSHIISHLLTLNPAKRLTAARMLSFGMFIGPRVQYHEEMCSCCYEEDGKRMFTTSPDPITFYSYDSSWEKYVRSIEEVKREIYMFVENELQDTLYNIAPTPERAVSVISPHRRHVIQVVTPVTYSAPTAEEL